MIIPKLPVHGLVPLQVSCRVFSQEVIGRGRVPIIVGGTSFYFNFLLKGATGAPESTAESKEAVDMLLEEDKGDWEKR